ncbi:MAG TPA: hypothetical protein VLS51_10975 [Propionibacteriaceae bacterium]|nr:hypothetical protein [Propionibacteriaceae bacterium]
MQTELFVHFAEIAGIFVGFGALIALRGERPADLHDVMYVKAVLTLGVLVVVAALVPVAVKLSGVRDHALWLSCALFFLVLWAVGIVSLNMTAEGRAINSNLDPVDRFFPVVGLPLHIVIAGSLVVIVTGLVPGMEQALYVTALTAGVVFGGYTLLIAVLSRHEPRPHPGEGAE